MVTNLSFCINFSATDPVHKAGGLKSAKNMPNSFTEDLPAAVSSSSFAAADFQIDWHRLPHHLRTACFSGSRPSPQLRRECIQIIGDQLLNHNERPTGTLCLQAALQILLRHPAEQDYFYIGENFTLCINTI